MALHDKSPPRAFLAGLLAAMALAPLSAGAQVTIDTNPLNPPREEIQFDLDNLAKVGNPVYGTTNQTNQVATFTSNEDLSVGQAQGQAVLEAVDGAFSTVCIDLNYASNTMKFFTGLEFVVDSRVEGDITITAFHTNGAVVANLPLAGVQGQDRFRVLADPGVLLTQVCFETDPDVMRALQFRIKGVQGGPPDIDEIPEPGSLALLAGGGLPLLGFLRRRLG